MLKSEECGEDKGEGTEREVEGHLLRRWARVAANTVWTVNCGL